MQLTHDEITRLSPDERLTLIAQLWDSLDDHQVQLTEAQEAELDRRLATLDYDRTESVTWETLKAELEQRCP
jgi:putative addiction module component (TIGR02574 family)